VGGT